MIISSIDLKDGKVVQLKNGRDKVLEQVAASFKQKSTPGSKNTTHTALMNLSAS